MRLLICYIALLFSTDRTIQRMKNLELIRNNYLNPPPSGETEGACD